MRNKASIQRKADIARRALKWVAEWEQQEEHGDKNWDSVKMQLRAVIDAARGEAA